MEAELNMENISACAQNSCGLDKYKDIVQLYDKDRLTGRVRKVFPITYIQAVYDGKTGASLESILAQYNNVFLQFMGTAEATRVLLPKEMRRKGIQISYRNMEDEVIVEKCVNDSRTDDTHWGLSANWARIDELSLSGEISVSAKGTWIINGEDTGIKAVGPKGDNGLTPWLKTIDNKLYHSYDNKTWEPSSDYIAAWFRFTGTSGSSQAGNVGKIQISRDEGKTWTDLSGTFTNNLRISGYRTSVDLIPEGQPQGAIWAIGPTYASDDTAHTNPIYRLHVKDESGWVDNGQFTSIAAGVVQELGDSETEVISQKAISNEIKSLKILSSIVSIDNYLDNFINIDLQRGVIQFPEGTVIYCNREQYKLPVTEVSIICTKFDGTEEASSYSYLLFNRQTETILNITATYVTIDRLNDYVILGAIKKSAPTIDATDITNLVIYGAFDYTINGNLYRTTDFSFIKSRLFPISFPLFINGVWYNGGELNRSVSYSSSLPIKINKGEDIYIGGYNKVGGVGLVLNFYNNNLQFISGVGGDLKSGLKEIVVKSDDIPLNAEYFIVNSSSSIMSDKYIIHSTVEDIKGNYILSKDYKYYGYINKITGNHIYDESYILTGYIKLASNKTYITSAREGTSGAAVSFYDDNYNFVGALEKQTIIEGNQQLIMFTSDEAPSGAVYFMSNSEAKNKGFVIGASVLDMFSPSKDEIIFLNKDALSNIDALRYSFDTKESNYENIQKKDNLIFLYGSDLHKDYLTDSIEECPSLNRMINVYDYINPDFMIITGDVVADNYSNDYSFLVKAIGNRVYLPIIGNHEIINATTQSELYTKYIQPFENSSSLIVHSKNGIKQPYYSKVIKNIRIICVNNYDYGDSPMGYGECYSQEQVDWFINELELANSNDQSVIVAMHYTPDSNFNTDSNFRQKYTIYNNEPRLTTSSRSILLYIIESFMKGSIIYNDWSQGEYETITINHTFQKKGKFVCYLTGHRHGDYTSYSEYFPKQIILNTASTYYGSNSVNLCDLVRSPNGINRDLFNIVSVNIRNSELNMVRIGAQFSSKLIKRDCIKYDL